MRWGKRKLLLTVPIVCVLFISFAGKSVIFLDRNLQKGNNIFQNFDKNSSVNLVRKPDSARDHPPGAILQIKKLDTSQNNHLPGKSSVYKKEEVIKSIIHGEGGYNLKNQYGHVKGVTSWAQYGQDMQIDKLFNQMRNGFFIEVGGYEGEIYSNTLLLERERNWSGILIEADPDNFKRMVKKDRNCYMLHGCISNTLANMTFLLSDSLTSAKEIISERHRKRIYREMANKVATITVQCYSLAAVMESINRTHVDYFSLDVEGGELHILNSIDFNKLDIDVFTIETDQHRSDIISFMENHGYKRISKISGDDVFRKIKS